MRGGYPIITTFRLLTLRTLAVTHALLCAVGGKGGIVLRIEGITASISIKCGFGEISPQRSEKK